MVHSGLKDFPDLTFKVLMDKTVNVGAGLSNQFVFTVPESVLCFLVAIYCTGTSFPVYFLRESLIIDDETLPIPIYSASTGSATHVSLLNTICEQFPENDGNQLSTPPIGPGAVFEDLLCRRNIKVTIVNGGGGASNLRCLMLAYCASDFEGKIQGSTVRIQKVT